MSGCREVDLFGTHKTGYCICGVSQFMHNAKETHLTVVHRMLKGNPGRRILF